MSHIEDMFRAVGGQFITPAATMIEKLKNIKAFVFDWDGVFNDAVKSQGMPNGFSEADSMGINLVRYDYYVRSGELPVSAIISGEENPTAVHLAKRESFFALYYRMKNKGEALEHFCKQFNLKPENIAWFYDDVLDFALAEKCGLRFYITRKSQPLTNLFAFNHNIVDYISGHDGGSHALRECCELLMALSGNFDKVLKNRMAFAPHYAEYFATRNDVKPLFFTKKDDLIEEVSL